LSCAAKVGQAQLIVKNQTETRNDQHILQTLVFINWCIKTGTGITELKDSNVLSHQIQWQKKE